MSFKKPFTSISLLAAVLIVGGFSVLPTAAANTQGSGDALEIAPPVINLKADPGQTIKTNINLRDVSNSKLLVANEINDFVAGGEDGTPKILLDNSQPNPYSLRDWVVALPTLTLQPHQIKQLPVTIHVPKNASPGGYYGVIRFTASSPDPNGNGVSLSASLGSLVLLRVNGAVKESMSVAEFSTSQSGKTGTLFQFPPVDFTVRLKNDGNVFEQPVGQIAITDMFNRKVANVNVNLEQRNVLPQSIRRFDQPLDSSVIGNKILFGLYHANLRVVYGANQQVITASATFWVIPYTLIGIIIVVLVVGFFVLRFLIKRYNRHIINQAQKRR